ncbi:MAG: hypothetical protein KKI20_06215, partial [Gammaproteobacteria bacterium]|nr:hypothetical protein [Gammaproteobacteria bacterium]
MTYSFPFDPFEILEVHFSEFSGECINTFVQEAIDAFRREAVVNDIKKQGIPPVVQSATQWALEILETDIDKFLSVPEHFNDVLNQPNGIHALDYILGCFQKSLTDLEIQRLLDYFFTILGRYKIQIP